MFKFLTLFALVGCPAAQAAKGAPTILFLKVGMLQKVSCKGRLQVSAVGDERKIQVEALPKALGCSVVLRPLKPGRTNLLLETSAESILRPIRIISNEAFRQPALEEHGPQEKGAI